MRPMRLGEKRCRMCVAERAAEANRAYQRKRRRRETLQRKEAAGHLQGKGFFRFAVMVPCAHCGEKFKPQRTTARYCSARCRVAAHRAKLAGQVEPAAHKRGN
jgi:hypothetical protein